MIARDSQKKLNEALHLLQNHLVDQRKRTKGYRKKLNYISFWIFYFFMHTGPIPNTTDFSVSSSLAQQQHLPS